MIRFIVLFSLLPLGPPGLHAGGLSALGPHEWAPSAFEETPWLPWLGCWEATTEEESEEGSETLVCILPVAGGVEITTLRDGESTESEFVQANTGALAHAEGGCAGTREARWSSDGQRLFLLSDLRCAEGVNRSSAGVFAMTGSGGTWTEIHAIRSGTREPVLAVRSFRPASAATLHRHAFDPAPDLGDRDLAIVTSRVVASAPLDLNDVQEAVQLGGGPLASALMLEMGDGFDLNGAELQRLARNGVPADVLDMMIALTWPEQFQIEAGQAEPLESQGLPASDRRAVRPWPGPTVAWGYGSSYGSCGFGARYCYDPYYAGLYAYGYPYGGGYYGGPGWFPARVRYIYVTPPTIRERGRVSPVTGYQAPRSPARPAQPTGGRATPPPPASATPAPGVPTARPEASRPPARTAPAPQGRGTPASTPAPATAPRPATPRPTSSSGSGSGSSAAPAPRAPSPQPVRAPDTAKEPAPGDRRPARPREP